MNVFITGTDTDVGKTYYCGLLASRLITSGQKTAYFKPFQSGTIEGVLNDADYIKNLNPKIDSYTGYVSETPCTPLVSAMLDYLGYELEFIKNKYNELAQSHDSVIVEGSGGLFVPVKENVLMIDIVKMLNLPVILVARPNLGTINHALMSIECLKSRGIKIQGVVINNYPVGTDDIAIQSARPMIEDFSGVPVIEVIGANVKE